MAFAPKPLHEQVIVITGASSGIGLTTARMAAEAGAKVLLVARNESALRHIVQDLRANGGVAEFVVADVSRPEDHTRIAKVALQHFGGFDTWVNGAAVGTAGELMDVPVEDQRRVLNVNYWGVVYGSLEAARHLRHRGGVLINIGSVLGERAVVLQVPYCAAKHAVRAFTDGLRMELEHAGVPVAVTHIKPSSIDTPFPEHARNFLKTGVTVPPPIYSPDLVAKAILFACENPKRDIVVGFGGWAVSLMGTLVPRMTDLLMEAIGYWAQKTTRQAIPARRDNLYHPRQDGAERSSFEYPVVRKSSLLLQAQMHPFATAFIVGGMTVGLVAVGMTRGSGQRRVLRRQQAQGSFGR